MKLNKKQTADMFGKSVVTIGKWIDAGMPCDKQPDGKGLDKEWIIDSAAAIEWRCQQLLEGVRGRGEKSRLEEIKEEMAEIDLAERRGEVVNADDQLKVFGKLLSDVRQRLVAMPGSMAAILASLTVPADIQRELSRGIRDCLEDIHAHYGISKKG